jgi:hypothetical protein
MPGIYRSGGDADCPAERLSSTADNDPGDVTDFRLGVVNPVGLFAKPRWSS